jgi:hypothetical protein
MTVAKQRELKYEKEPSSDRFFYKKEGYLKCK